MANGDGVSDIKLNLFKDYDEAEFLKRVKFENIEAIVLYKDFDDSEISYKDADFQKLLTKYRLFKSDLKLLNLIENKSKIKSIQILLDLESEETLKILYQFENLENLSIGNSVYPFTFKLHVTAWKDLKKLTTNGNIEIIGLDKINLKTLIVNENKKFKIDSCGIALRSLQFIASKPFNLKDFSDSADLRSLTLTQTSIRSLEGIGHYEELMNLQINYCSKLTDISALGKCQSLQVVAFESCKNIQDLTPLTALKNLKQLVLFKCGEIPSLGFINEIPSLESILFTETNILDGDLRPCLRLKSAWSSTGKRHYNINVEDLPHN